MFCAADIVGVRALPMVFAKNSLKNLGAATVLISTMTTQAGAAMAMALTTAPAATIPEVATTQDVYNNHFGTSSTSSHFNQLLSQLPMKQSKQGHRKGAKKS